MRSPELDAFLTFPKPVIRVLGWTHFECHRLYLHYHILLSGTSGTASRHLTLRPKPFIRVWGWTHFEHHNHCLHYYLFSFDDSRTTAPPPPPFLGALTFRPKPIIRVLGWTRSRPNDLHRYRHFFLFDHPWTGGLPPPPLRDTSPNLSHPGFGLDTYCTERRSP